MTRTLAAATALLALASPAIAGERRTFTHEGYTYTYTSKISGDAKILEGKAEPLGGTFRLVIRKGWVSGYANNRRVSFRVSEAVATRIAPVTLAQN